MAWQSFRAYSRLFMLAVALLQIILSDALIMPTETSASAFTLVVNTWPFTNATSEAWQTLERGGTLLDAVEAGCSRCERQQCGTSVGFGNHPDENGEVTLDAMIMDGNTMKVGSVGGIRQIKSAISVARHIMEHTSHTLLVGELATQFAVEMGFERENLSTPASVDAWTKWQSSACQPNFWQNVVPDADKSCGPYKPMLNNRRHNEAATQSFADEHNHDTIGMLALTFGGNQTNSIACGTSTNGAIFKVPGRVGDSPIVGAGAYCDAEVGGAVGTGDGDIMMRFVASAVAVERMAAGDSPQQAAQYAIDKIRRRGASDFAGAVLAVSAVTGEIGAACNRFGKFPYSVISNATAGQPKLVVVQCS